VQPYVLVMEDEDALATLLSYNLEKEGYRVVVASDGEEGMLQIEERLPDLVLLDWMLPKLSGIEVCRRIRGKSETRNMPIIMLTARGEESDRIRGLDTGADDYLTKPFSMSELIARIRAVLRRIRPGLADDRLNHGDIVIDRVAHRVRRAGNEIHLGPTEFRLLDHLMQHPGRVFSREQLLDAVWGSGRLCRGPHGRRPRRPPAQGAECRGHGQSDPDGAVRGLFAGSGGLTQPHTLITSRR
jgi:two-component system phosphate regulon response regulator PhoB